MKYSSRVKCGLAFIIAALPVLALSAPPPIEDGGEIERDHVKHLTDDERDAINQELEQGIQSLQKNKFTAPYGASTTQPEFIWPIRKAIGVEDFNVDAVSNYVDHDPVAPNSVLDYNCGQRTYDVPGYNHKGIDIFTWPFSWAKQINSDVEVISAAAGTIVNKSDGNSDTSCSLGGGSWNAVYVMHGDGSIAWYGHLKKNSVTSKPVGATVAAGEYLGVVGSSGNSTGPHLHLEIYNAQGNLIDPYQGSCNALNNDSWWKNQPTYYDTQINALGVGNGSVQFRSCPQQAITNFTNTYMYGDAINFSAFYRDQLNTIPSAYSIEKPDGNLLTFWNHSSPVAHYSASWWSWGYSTFTQSMSGIWQFKVEYNNVDYASEFYLVDSCGSASTVPSQNLFSSVAYGATSSLTTQTNSISVNPGARMTLLAGNVVTIGNGFSVANTGNLTVKNVSVCG